MRQFNINSFSAGFCLFAAIVMFTMHSPLLGCADLLFVAVNTYVALRKV